MWSPRGWIERAAVVVRGGVIEYAGREADCPSGLAGSLQAEVDAGEGYLVPGFIDLHAHGALGRAVDEVEVNGLCELSSFWARCGVTAWLPTALALPGDGMERMLEVGQEALVWQGEGEWPAGAAEVLGLHLEGPFLNPAWSGAQLGPALVEPSPGRVRRWLERAPQVVRLFTLAPELPGAREAAQEILRAGGKVALGHTGASYEDVVAAVGWGCTYAVHTFNAMAGWHHRQPGAAGAVLDRPEMQAEVIADGVHVHPAAVRLLVRAKGARRVVAASDASPLAGLPEGSFCFWQGRRIEARGGAARLEDGTLAGSLLTLDQALRNLVAWGIPLHAAVRMVTLTPAEAIGASGRKGSLAPGKDADLVILDSELRVRQVVVRGRPLEIGAPM